MKILIDNNNAEGIHQAIKKRLKSKFLKSGFEFQSQISNAKSNLTLLSYEFDKGFNLNILKGDIPSLFLFDFNEDENNYLRFFFIKKGELIHTVSPSIRYRLTENYSCMVAAKGEKSQLFTFPVQKAAEIIFLQIEAKSFSIDLKNDFFGLPKEIGDVLRNQQMGSHFIYHGSYTLNICDTINEIINTEKEGMVRRFFLESKALELLWLQTEQFKQETIQGYNPKVLRKNDILIIKKAKDYIHENLSENLTLKFVAKAIGTNETKLKSGFKKLFGKTFTEILRSERLKKAKWLLEEGQLTIKEIAQSCGYKSTSMFSARFKERYGRLPSKYKLS